MHPDKAGRRPPSRVAIFSDVHSNWEALEAVLEDIGQQRVSRMICLGDTVGYAANPRECLERVLGLGCPVLKGNHDEWVAEQDEFHGINPMAEAGFVFSRAALNEPLRRQLVSLPLTHRDGKTQFVHASLDAPEEWHYVDCTSEARMHFEKQSQPLCFCGHTHVPAMIWQQEAFSPVHARDGVGCLDLPKAGKCLVNVGSVGQPRDENPDACYVIHDVGKRQVEFRRIPYDVEKTVKKIRAARLPSFTGKRLLQGV